MPENKAKARWSILRASILKNKYDLKDDEESVSIHKFPGFQLIPRKKLLRNDEISKFLARLTVIHIEITYTSKTPHFDNLTSLIENQFIVSILCIHCIEGVFKKEIQITLELVHLKVDDARLKELIPNLVDTLKQRDLMKECKFEFCESMENKKTWKIHVPLSKSNSIIENSQGYSCYEYLLSTSNSSLYLDKNNKIENCFYIITRECSSKRNIGLKAMVSHRNNGVDNTGNIRVWDCELTLAHFLLNGAFEIYMELKKMIQVEKILRVIELGVGMAGIAGLVVAIMPKQNSIFQNVSIDVTLTDGHEKAILNNQICQRFTFALASSYPNNISCRKLKWNHSQQGLKDCNALTNSSKKLYQLCLVSDCLHFVDFHLALIATIARLLCLHGICILCQPTRGKSLDLFLQLIQIINSHNSNCSEILFEISSMENKDYQTWLDQKHEELSEKSKSACNTCVKNDETQFYNPNIHFPKIIILKKMRPYNEHVDTQIAVDYLNRI